MKFLNITPIHEFDGKFVKREDLAYWQSLEYPSGSKVRQYISMACMTAKSLSVKPNSAPCLVGCSANSAMQIYVAATAKQLNVKGIIYVPKRKVRSDATNYAIRMGAEINEVKPGYLSVIRKAARQKAIDLKHYVGWNRKAAIEDTIDQCVNIPEDIKRIIVPTGSGLTAAGVLVGIAKHCLFPGPEVVAVCTSPMTDGDRINKLALSIANDKDLQGPIQSIRIIGPTTPYDIPVVERLPDGTPLDCFYAAKAWKYTQPGDLFWPVGLRPIISMPEVCQKEFKDWEGPQ